MQSAQAFGFQSMSQTNQMAQQSSLKTKLNQLEVSRLSKLTVSSMLSNFCDQDLVRSVHDDILYNKREVQMLR